MAAPSKTKKFESLTKVLQKRYKGLPLPPERSVLEHLVYAALLENALVDQADSAFTVLENYFIDWNEIRVSTVGELADTFAMLPDPQAAGERVRRLLQGVFEKTYMFDLEDFRKKTKSLGQVTEFLESLSACSRFMVAYTTQVAFGGHVIPLEEASLRIFRLLGLAQVNKEGTQEEVAGLERAVSKKHGLHFSTQLHHFGAIYYQDPESEELRSVLKSIDPEALKRDWTPPVLTLSKTSVKPPPPVVHATLPATIPFVHDDDEFDESGGMEAEFIEDGSEVFLTEEKEERVDVAGKRIAPPLEKRATPSTETRLRKEKGETVVSSKGKKVERKKKELPDKKSSASASETKEKPPKKEKAKSSDPPSKKKAGEVTSKRVSSSEKGKTHDKSVKKKTSEKKEVKSSAPKTKSPGPSKGREKSVPAAGNKAAKSPTRQLRGKKPK